MAQQWLVLRPAAAGEPVPVPPQNLPNAILGELKVTTSYATDENHQYLVDVTIGISWPGGDKGDVDRLIVHLFAPDTTVDTQEGFVGGPGTGGSTVGQEVPGLIIGDASNASKIVSIESSAILIEKPWDANRPFVHFTHPAPTANENWKAIVVSASKTAKNKVESSPFKQFLVKPKPPDVSGVEYAPLALDFHLVDRTGATTNLPYYDVVEGGAPKWGFSGVWTNDTRDPRFAVLGGYDLVIEYPGGLRETHASKSSNDTRHDSPMWDIGAPGSFTVWLVSFTSQAGNLRNSIIPGLTPSRTFHVAAPVGPVGKDYADHVLKFRLENPYYYAKNGAGQKTLYLPFVWEKPDDRAYGGCIIVMIRADGKHYPLTGLETDDNQTCELQQFPITGQYEAVKFYCKSVSASGKVNEYVPGETPEVSITLGGPPQTNPLVSSFTATEFYVTTNETGLVTYGYSGSWLNPSNPPYSEFQGVKIAVVEKNAGLTDWVNRIDLTGIETKQSFKTAGDWDTPATNSPPKWIIAISVDVNGIERIPGVNDTGAIAGPRFITPKGGTLSNEMLPDIDVANFASGIEPIRFVDEPSDGTGGLTIPKGDTSTVFNTADDRLYRWNDAFGKYRQIGGGPDIAAGEITANHLLADAVIAGKIAAGAIRTRELAANEILVGPTPGAGGASTDRPPIFKVNDLAGGMVGLFGTYSEWQGIYALNMRIGPTFLNPTLEGTAAGLFLRGDATRPVDLLISRSSSLGAEEIRLTTDPVYFDPTYSSIAISVATQANLYKTTMVSRGIIGYETRFGYQEKLFAVVRDDIGSAGQVVLYGPPTSGSTPETRNPIRVLISGCDELNPSIAMGMIRAQRYDVIGYDLSGNINPAITGTGYSTTLFVSRPAGNPALLEFKGGILTNVTYT